MPDFAERKEHEGEWGKPGSVKLIVQLSQFELLINHAVKAVEFSNIQNRLQSLQDASPIYSALLASHGHSCTGCRPYPSRFRAAR